VQAATDSQNLRLDLQGITEIFEVAQNGGRLAYRITRKPPVREDGFDWCPLRETADSVAKFSVGLRAIPRLWGNPKNPPANQFRRDSSRCMFRAGAAKPTLLLRYTRLMFTEYLKKRMQDLLGYGLAMEGLALIEQTEPSK
jgi:hypothetical protein